MPQIELWWEASISQETYNVGSALDRAAEFMARTGPDISQEDVMRTVKDAFINPGTCSNDMTYDAIVTGFNGYLIGERRRGRIDKMRLIDNLLIETAIDCLLDPQDKARKESLIAEIHSVARYLIDPKSALLID